MKCFFQHTGQCHGEVQPGVKTWLSALAVVDSESGYCEFHRSAALGRARWEGVRARFAVEAPKVKPGRDGTVAVEKVAA